MKSSTRKKDSEKEEEKDRGEELDEREGVGIWCFRCVKVNNFYILIILILIFNFL